MNFTLKQEITSFYQAEEVFYATKEKLSDYFTDNDTITLELYSEQDRLGGCESNIQLAHYINILSTLQRLSFISKDLSLPNNNNAQVNKFGLITTILLTYTSLFIEHLYKPRIKVKKEHLLRPKINVFKNKLPNLIQLITNEGIDPDITTYILTEQTNIVEEFIELFHHTFIETDKIYNRINIKIPFTSKVLWSYSFPKWKYRYLHHIYKSRNTSPLTLLSIKQEIDKNHTHIDCEVIIDKLFNKILAPLINRYSTFIDPSTIPSFYKGVRETYLSRYKHNKKVKTEIILTEKGGD